MEAPLAGGQGPKGVGPLLHTYISVRGSSWPVRPVKRVSPPQTAVSPGAALFTLWGPDLLTSGGPVLGTRNAAPCRQLCLAHI